MAICEGEGLLDLEYGCIRAFWSTAVPAALLLGFLIIRAPKPRVVNKLLTTLTSPFTQFLSYHQAEALEVDETGGEDLLHAHPPRPPIWRTLILASFSLMEALVWLVVGSAQLTEDAYQPWNVARAYVAAASWLYATVRPISHPIPTAPNDLFMLFLAHFAIEVLQLGSIVHAHSIYAVDLPPAIVMAGHILNLLVILLLLSIIMTIPMGLPSSRVNTAKIGTTVSPEDYTTLWEWVTFKWVWPLVKRGRNTTLSEDDVWNLGPTMRSRPVFLKFSRNHRRTLLRKILSANSLDLILDFTGSYVSIFFNYATPYFLKRILDSIDPTLENRSQAYIFALLAFLSQVLKAQADLQHLWYGRRAATRIRSELMASIYDKALKRRDYSGVAEKNKPEPESATKGDDPKAGADIGKIVNLMAGDANRVAMTTSAMYFVYGAPFEIFLGSVFLYDLLGWSAFSGFVVLIAIWPLNSYVTRRSIRIFKGVTTARDKRMGVINELIGAVKLIKFFAWEDKWIDKALEAREKEMKWLIKSRFNSVMFSALWSLAPVLVSAVSFAVYVYRGHELTVATAFTAIALFQMIRMPLNVLPSWIVQILQTKVALDRIDTFLGEDEVDGQVSSLKTMPTGAYTDEETYESFGIVNGTFKWNEVPQKPERKKKDPNGKTSSASRGAHTPVLPVSSTDMVEVDRASITSVEGGDRKFELKDISVMFPEGKLTLVTGPTASGKTALLMAMLGEMTTVNGRILMRKDSSRVYENGLTHTISYAAQAPWLRHQSIRDNILFGYPHDDVRYKAVIEACALQQDLDILEDGDATEIGARGVSLSGGQKARVALARAVYSPAKYVLLDDPLSAVDSHTARFLFEKLFCGELLKGRTIVLVTHHVELVLPGAQYIVRMLDGRIDTQGTVSELQARGVLDDITHESSAEVAREEQAAAAKKTEPSPEEVAATGIEEQKEKKPRKLIKEEERQAGSVKWNIYKTYLQASSYWTWAILGFFIALVQVLVIAEKVWVKIWGEAYASSSNSTLSTHSVSFSIALQHLDGENSGIALSHAAHGLSSYATPPQMASLPDAVEHPLFYVGVFTSIGVASALTAILSNITQYTGALRASRLLFKRLLSTVVRASMRWHDTTPAGRMLNRFSKDIETVDSSLASSLQAVNTSMASLLASVLTVTYVFPVFLIPAFAIGVVYYSFAIGYLNTGRDLRRMESNSRSPIFSGFGELLEGIVTVRAFSAEKRFLDGLHTKIDGTTKMWYNFWMLNRWLLLNFDILGASAVLITTLFALSGLVNVGTAGICITSAMSFTQSIYWTCRFWTGLELDLNSVERVVEYLDLPQEPPAVIEDNRPPPTWPSSDSPNLLVVDDLVVKYAPELPAVLKNVSFALRGGERVGLLGRTGSGKSTLAMSVLRFVDPSGGRIILDGIDVTTIGLHDLRSRITFIPQDATLFSGTLRENLDPFNEHDDIECLDVLYRVQMLTETAYQSQKSSRQASRVPTRPPSPNSGSSATETVAEPSLASVTEVDSKAPVSLETKVSPGGSNFSQGQRQLIAMARALLRRSSIIVLDEATSSIDFATDAKIQKTIREEFSGSLLLTVAHRLRTVIDYDRLIVLDKGTVAELDTPWNLIQKEDGIFRGMCMKSGMFTELKQIAKEKAGL